MRALYDSTLKAIHMETGGQPSVFVFDDLQWVDPASLGLIEHTLQLVTELPLFILCAMRPEPEAPAWDLRLRLPAAYNDRFSELSLDPLSDGESIRLADALMAMEAVPEGLRRLVLTRAEGNPFYIEELVQMLHDRGPTTISALQNGMTEGDWSHAGDIPANLLSLVAARVDRLSRDVRLTLQLAAVIGRSFYVRVLRLIGQAQIGLESHLQQLETAEMIRESARVPEWEYMFRHALTQEAVYSTLLIEQRRSFHRAVGQALEQLFPKQLEEFAPVLAHHYDEAQQLDKATHYYVLAGNEAAVLYANEQAVAYYKRALAITKGQGAATQPIIDLYGRLGRVLEHLHRFDEASRLYAELEDLGQKRGVEAMELASLTSRIILYANPTSLFDPDEVETLAGKALDLADKLGDRAAEARLYLQLCTLNSFMGRTKESLDFGERAVSRARNLGNRFLLAQVLNDVSSHLYSMIGDFERAAIALSESRELWKEFGDRAMEADSLSTLAEMSVYTGDFDRALTLSEEARVISRSIRNPWGESHSQIMAGLVYWERGRPDLAMATMGDSIRLGEAAGFMVPQALTRSDLGLLYFSLGNTEAALDLITLAQDRAGNMGLFISIYSAGILAQIQLADNDLDAAEATLDGIGDHLTGRPESVMYIPGYQAGIDLAMCRGEAHKAVEIAGELLNYLRDIRARPYQMQVLLQRAEALRALNRPEEARASLLEAQSLGEDLDSRWTMWQIEAQLGRLSDDDGKAGHYRRAQEHILYIHDHTPDHLKDSFLGRSAVQAVLATADRSWNSRR